MSRGLYISAEEAHAIDNLLPGSQLYGLGSRLKAALDFMSPGIPDRCSFVWGSYGSDSATGKSYDNSYKTIQKAIDNIISNSTIFVLPNLIPALGQDPINYAENLIIPAGLSNIKIIGIGTGRTQGGLPQIKKGSGSSALLTIRSPGCAVVNMGINGGGSTGGGVLMDDNGTTKIAFGTSILGCHFKNCRGSSALDASTGGAIQASGIPYQVLIKGNKFYKNVGDICVISAPNDWGQDWVIEDNIFSDPAANVDCNLYLHYSITGISSLNVRNNVFPALPALSSAVNHVFTDLTYCTGIICNNMFGGTGTSTGYGDGKANAKIPTTMLMPHNYSESGLITRQA